MAGRRINPIEPTKSLLLMKPTGEVALQGGQRFERDDVHYELLRDWIAEERIPIQVVLSAWELRFTLRQDVC